MRRRLAAFLGSNPRDDDSPDAALHEPNIESAADKHVVRGLEKDGVGRDGKPG